MRVLHVSTAREWRGGQAQLFHLATAGGEDLVAVPADAPLAPRLGDRAVPVPFRGRWWGTGELARVVARVRPNLLAAHDAHAVVHALSVSGVPVVVHRRVDFAPSRWGAARWRRAAGVIAVSGAVARVLRGAGVRRLAVVHDGVPLAEGPADPDGVRADLGLPPGTPLVAAVGALVGHKGHATLVDAVARRPGLHVAVLGEGPLRADLRARAERLGIGGRVHLPGVVGDVGRWHRSVDAVVHPSLLEGLGQAVVEAVGAGACVVTSDAGGLPEIPGVAHRYPAGDADALAAVLGRTLQHPEPGRRVARAAAGRLRAGFSVEAMVRGTRAAWDSFLGDENRTAR